MWIANVIEAINTYAMPALKFSLIGLIATITILVVLCTIVAIGTGRD